MSQPPGLVSRMAARVRENAVLARHDRLRGVLRGVYRAGVLAATRGRGPLVTVNGRDRFRFVNHFSPALDWEPELHDAMDRLLRPGMTALDVGANCGTFTMIMAARVGGGEDACGRVIAFEPAPDSRAALERNLGNNGFADIARVEGALIGDREGEGVLHWVRGRNSLVNSVHGDSEDLRGHDAAPLPVAMTTLDAYLAREGVRPDLIKIDVEGAETLVLRGARQTLAAARAPVLLLEVHPDALESSGSDMAEIRRMLDTAGYRIANLDGSPLDEIDGRMQILAVK